MTQKEIIEIILNEEELAGLKTGKAIPELSITGILAAEHGISENDVLSALKSDSRFRKSEEGWKLKEDKAKQQSTVVKIYDPASRQNSYEEGDTVKFVRGRGKEYPLRDLSPESDNGIRQFYVLTGKVESVSQDRINIKSDYDGETLTYILNASDSKTGDISRLLLDKKAKNQV